MEAQRGIKAGSRLPFALLVLAIVLSGLLLGPRMAEAAPLPLFWKSGENCGSQQKILAKECGSGLGETIAPAGVVADPDTGSVYVVDGMNARIDEFSPWGVFLKAWGWGVADGSPEPQTCGPAATPPSTGCLQGIAGGGAGQLTGEVPIVDARGITRDSAGNLYVYEAKGCTGGTACEASPHSNRVQKFTPSGDFLLTFGKEVNLTAVELREQQEANAEPVTVTPAEENLCTAASGDECGPGVQGSGPGEFGTGPLSSTDLGSSVIAAGPGDAIYVGGQERIQKFSSAGAYLGSVGVPAKVIQALAVDPNGNFYIAGADTLTEAQPNVFKLTPAGAPVCTIEVTDPRAIALDASETVYVAGQATSNSLRYEVFQFANDCSSLDGGVGSSATLMREASGLATSSACGISGTEVLATDQTYIESFLAAFGPPPDATICPPPPVPPSIGDQYATSVDSSSATVKATIDPEFWPDAHYYVEYGEGKCSEAGCAPEPSPPGLLLTSTTTSEALPTSAMTLRGLAPDTTHHYRFVAESGGGGPVLGSEATFHTFPLQARAKADCPNQAFRTGASAFLPDCRAYEMVSPVDKNNTDISIPGAGGGGYTRSSRDGERVTYQSLRAFAGAEGAPLGVQYLARRDPGAGWLTHPISARREAVSMYQAATTNLSLLFRSFSDDLCFAHMVQDTRIALVPGAFTGAPNLYRRSNCGSSANGYELLTTVPPPGFGPDGDQFIEYFPLSQGASDDGSRTVFRANASLTADACTSPPKDIFQVYESTPEGLRLVSRLNEPTSGAEPPCVHASAGTAQGREGAISEDSVHNAISSDGSRIYWTASTSPGNQTKPGGGGGSGEQQGHLYLRAHSDREQSLLSKAGKCVEPEKACTYKVSELVSGQPARFLTADESGTRALFSVDPDGKGSGGGPETTNLYEFEASGEGALSTKATLVSKGLVGLMGASENLDRQYFASTEALAGAGANSEGAEAQPGEPNLYLYERGVGYLFVATLAGLDVLDVEASNSNAPPSPLSAAPFLRTSRVTESGGQALFMSAAPLTGIDNTDVASGRPDAQVYLYDRDDGTGSGELVCVSCNVTGARPMGEFVVGEGSGKIQLWASALLPGWIEEQQPSRLLSDSGERAFFESFDALVPRDTNGARDVYQWERAGGKADCLANLGGEIYSPESGGCLSLVSSGQNRDDSLFVDANENGSSVFLSTFASLLPQDPGLRDVYVARQGGGFPPPPTPAPECEGEACQSPSSPPNDRTPASAGLRGAGNVPQAVKCRKGQRKVTNRKTRRARCVNAKKSKSQTSHSGRAGR